MSVSTEVQRTLVKSPPELWAELSSSEALAKHLGELGEIRITRAEPETEVQWEAEGANGVVQLKPSGWGTKVTLSLTRDLPQPEPASAPGTRDVDAAPEQEPEAGVDPEAEPVEMTVVVVEPRPVEAPPVADTTSDPPACEAVPIAETKRGFFARLFKRRSGAAATPEPVSEGVAEREGVAEPADVAEPEPDLEPQIEALALPEPVYPKPPPKPAEQVEPAQLSEPTPDLAAELADVEAQMEQESTELLTGVLDRLGAAHHRPFSRG